MFYDSITQISEHPAFMKVFFLIFFWGLTAVTIQKLRQQHCARGLCLCFDTTSKFLCGLRATEWHNPVPDGTAEISPMLELS